MSSLVCRQVVFSGLEHGIWWGLLGLVAVFAIITLSTKYSYFQPPQTIALPALYITLLGGLLFNHRLFDMFTSVLGTKLGTQWATFSTIFVYIILLVLFYFSVMGILAWDKKEQI